MELEGKISNGNGVCIVSQVGSLPVIFLLDGMKEDFIYNVPGHYR